MTEQSQQQSTLRAANSAELTAETLWLHYYSVGGLLDVFELDAYLHGPYPVAQLERNTIALALNELIDDLPQLPRAEFVHGPSPDRSTHTQ